MNKQVAGWESSPGVGEKRGSMIPLLKGKSPSWGGGKHARKNELKILKALGRAHSILFPPRDKRAKSPETGGEGML